MFLADAFRAAEINVRNSSPAVTFGYCRRGYKDGSRIVQQPTETQQMHRQGDRQRRGPSLGTCGMDLCEHWRLKSSVVRRPVLAKVTPRIDPSMHLFASIFQSD